jgi:hypothetical protein
MRRDCLALAAALLISGVPGLLPAQSPDSGEAQADRALCERRWPERAKEQQECMERQSLARIRLDPKLQAARRAGRGSAEHQVAALCQTRWGADWSRVERCYDAQLQGYWKLHPLPQPAVATAAPSAGDRPPSPAADSAPAAPAAPVETPE